MSTTAPKPTQADLLKWLKNQMVKLQLEEPTSSPTAKSGKDIDSKPESNVQAYPLKSDSDSHTMPHKVDGEDIVVYPLKIDSDSHSMPHKVGDADIGRKPRKRGLTGADIEALKRVLEQLKDSTVEEPADAAHGTKVDCYGW